ncbi:MAG: FkbM family methyltransferase [Bacteroidota bacterium]|nr:FkbM family methyltransferase [Bacteroidota bacterium]
MIKKNLYYPLKYSVSFRLYQRLFKPEEIKLRRKEINFYQSFLPPCQLIFDIGANDGHKTEAFLKIAGRVVCCEPDNRNYTILQTRFRNKRKKVFLENKALSDKEGYAEFHIHHPGSAFNTLSDKWMMLLEADKMEKWDESIKFTGKQAVGTTTLDHLIEKYGIPDFIKIDVEGYEKWVLKGLSHRVNYLSFESLLPEYAGELHECLSMITHLDDSAIFNVAKNEMLQFRDFVQRQELEKWINENQNALSFEIIAKMSA